MDWSNFGEGAATALCVGAVVCVIAALLVLLDPNADPGVSHRARLVLYAAIPVAVIAAGVANGLS